MLGNKIVATWADEMYEAAHKLAEAGMTADGYVDDEIKKLTSRISWPGKITFFLKGNEVRWAKYNAVAGDVWLLMSADTDGMPDEAEFWTRPWSPDLYWTREMGTDRSETWASSTCICWKKETVA